MSLNDGPNHNCLEGMMCPECGSYGPFNIVVHCIAAIFDSGVENTWDFGWGDESVCTCAICGHHRQVKDFKEEEGTNGSAPDEQEISAGEKVLLMNEAPGCYPTDPICTVVEKMVDKQTPCGVCGNLWYGYRGPDYWKNNPSYLLEFETGARGIFPVRRIRKMEGLRP
ncbi:MAG: hypothetical protein WC405_19900 [Syntrophales bacterium]